jgi:hypothetical protein
MGKLNKIYDNKKYDNKGNVLIITSERKQITPVFDAVKNTKISQ